MADLNKMDVVVTFDSEEQEMESQHSHNSCTDLLEELLPSDIEGITKEQDEEIMKMKQRQMFLDDVGVTVAMITVTLLAVLVVVLKVSIFSDKIDPNVSTFKPLDQQVKSIIKYTGNGFIPCEGYLPCDEEYSGG